MKNYEVGIIIGAIALVGYFWYKNSEGAPVQQPIAKGTAVPVSFTASPCSIETP